MAVQRSGYRKNRVRMCWCRLHRYDRAIILWEECKLGQLCIRYDLVYIVLIALRSACLLAAAPYG